MVATRACSGCGKAGHCESVNEKWNLLILLQSNLCAGSRNCKFSIFNDFMKTNKERSRNNLDLAHVDEFVEWHGIFEVLNFIKSFLWKKYDKVIGSRYSGSI